jgi:uncharacterized protein involved in response to NO
MASDMPTRRSNIARAEVAACALVLAAALLRSLMPLIATTSWLPAVPYNIPLIAAAVAWSCAFGIYLWVFAPWLMTSRLDGKDG